ncbi:hypothetical protein L3476_21955 [Paenibacillus thiaminolyticus]|nr:hypothetical protein [Paenibacillus thiaminolyticus]NGP60432.1 hypothetical protein [Paenibacillus thiaminolyticus]WCR25930.1 hypothetical protein L3476_21955 [Paenibacillus thiaminolyticus]
MTIALRCLDAHVLGHYPFASQTATIRSVSQFPGHNQPCQLIEAMRAIA